MLKQLIKFYHISTPATPLKEDKKKLKRLQWATFLSATAGYGIYYVCRLSLNVVKKPIVEEGIFSETELGIIGAVLFFTYAIGKFTNGFLADRSNIRRFMSTGLLITALANLCLGFTHSFILFAILWGISGWFQSMGAASCVVGLSRWFENKKRGSFYGFWSASHNIGEAMTFIIVASIVSALGWRYGFIGAGSIGIIGALIVWRFFHDSPESEGLPAVNHPQMQSETGDAADFNKAQRQALMMPAIWILAISSALMYVSRYAVNSWGVFYLEAQKGYSTLDASFIISIGSVCGIIGTMFSGVISDKFFSGRRNAPALIFGLMNVMALCLFLLVPGVHFWVDALSMVLFGTAIGVLLCFLGGLMAVDIAPRNASGAALGIVGIASYIGAGIQDIMSGIGIIGALIVWRFFHDSPESEGLPAVNHPQMQSETGDAADFNKAQRQALMMPAIWILAISSALMYVSRYAVNSWGVFYLEAQKGYSTLDASFIISIGSVCGIIGTMFSGVISDKFFSGRRNAPALIFGLMNVMALCLFLLVPGVHFWVDALSMVLFGTAIGVLLCFLGGLMAVDIAPRNASGAALGIVGIASYIGAGIQDIMSGILIGGHKSIVDGKEIYDFSYINIFWIGAALLSVFFALLVWNVKSKD